MPTPKDAWHSALSDDQLVEVVLDSIEEQVDESTEDEKIKSLQSLPSAYRALAVMSRVWYQVQNGGLPQFFFNMPDARWHAMAPEAARLMNMPETGKALETGGVLVRDLLPAVESGELDWTAFCEIVWEPFDSLYGPAFSAELKDFECRGATYIRSEPAFAEVAPKAMREHAEREKVRLGTEWPVTERERGLIFSADALGEYLDGFKPDEGRESLHARQSVNGTVEISYKYSDPEYGLSMLYDVAIHADEQDAEYWCEASSKSIWSALGWNMDPKRQVEEQNDFFRWGEQSYYSAVILEGSPFGFVFCARSGKKRLSLTLMGVLFQDPEALAEALGPALENLAKYQAPPSGGRP
jgi:hypothetical protein